MGHGGGLKEQLSFSTFRSGFALLERLSRRLEGLWPSSLSQLFRRFEPLLNPWLVFPLAFALICLRGLPWLTHPQFMIEDGPTFYQAAYDHGWRSVFETYGGYYHLEPRLAALLAASFPVLRGPLVMALCAIFVQAAVAGSLLSKRLENQIPSVWVRGLLALLIVGYPNAEEIFANVAHSQWYLCILGMAFLYCKPGKTRLTTVLEICITVLIAFTGPFSLVLAPLAWYLAWANKPRFGRRRVALALVWSVAFLVTVASLLVQPRLGHSGSHRPYLLVRMISEQVAIGSLQGLQEMRSRQADAFCNIPSVTYAFGVVAVLAYGFAKGSGFLKALICMGVFSFLSAVLTDTSWIALGNGLGERYFLFLGLSFLLGLVLLSRNLPWAPGRWALRALAVVAVTGILRNWTYPPPNPALDYKTQLASFARLPRGAVLDVQTPIDRLTKQFRIIHLRKR
ncbi:MAG TPA: hypothetical protein VG944_22575 [Fimbriimonas sp.]|nr:hypothetical protein [Fimbriimonas sp.]